MTELEYKEAYLKYLLEVIDQEKLQLENEYVIPIDLVAKIRKKINHILNKDDGYFIDHDGAPMFLDEPFCYMSNSGPGGMGPIMRCRILDVDNYKVFIRKSKINNILKDEQ